jgi:hypothetical protein
VENLFGSVDYDFSSGFSDVFDFFKVYFGGAWSYSVYAFYACGDQGG